MSALRRRYSGRSLAELESTTPMLAVVTHS
jgi:hypothetical protein